MPIERQQWRTVVGWDALNAQAKRITDVFDSAVRVDIRDYSVTATLALTYPHTLVRVTTTGGSVTLTLPPAATVPGFRIDVVKLNSANTLTLDGAGSETISGSATLAWTTQWQTYTLISIATGWVIV